VSGGTLTGNIVGFPSTSLAGGATQTFDFAVRADNDLSGIDTIYNQAILISGNDTIKSSPDSTDSCVACPTTIPVIHLVAWKTVVDSTGKAGFGVGDRLTYTIHVWNISTQAVAPVTILDTVPANTEYIDGSASNGGTYNAASNSLTFTLASLAPNGTDSVTFDVRVTSIADSIVNQATVIGDGDTVLTTTDSMGICTNCVTRIGLPVTGLQLSAQLQSNNNVLLNWGTTTEINSESFTVKRSVDGGNTWIVIGTQPSKAPGGNSSIPLTYNFTDPNLPVGNYEYQIIETDIDGDTLNSNIARIQVTGGAKIYPVPASNYIKVTLPAGATTVPYRLISSDGKIALSGTMSNLGSYGQISVSNVASDIYFLQITINNVMQTFKVQIQH
jgi:uncharacterized repeat protein (TIGR01451 family)